MGGIFAYLYERTGTLIAPIAIHSLHNGLIVTLALVFGESVG
ncbi:MAG: CPBP family glutamic-type intramembrane protease [Planctomycetota bacterium]|nr:CPBP family glutamic-type intramembrane protease [Planctomycetota bacterium]